MNHSPTGFWLFPSACHTCENRNIPEVHLHITHLYSKHVFIIYIYNIKNQYEYVDMVFPRFCLKPKANSSLWMSPTSGSKYRRAGCNLGLATTTASRCISGGQFMNKRSNNMNRYTYPPLFDPMAPGSVRVSKLQCALLLCLACPPVVCLDMH